MKNFSFFFMLCFVGFSIGLIHSCKKEAAAPVPDSTPQGPVITTSFIEEFKDVTILTATTGWVTENNSADENDYGLTDWGQGIWGVDKSGQEYGITAYSDSADKDEYAFSGQSYDSISSWLITPALSVKNGDKISFYTCVGSLGSSAERMQVLMNKSTSTDVGGKLSAGSFTTTLLDINPAEAPGGYPTSWKKYEYTFTNISGQMNTRIAFRHYVINPKNVTGIGIDVFSFLVK